VQLPQGTAVKEVSFVRFDGAKPGDAVSLGDTVVGKTPVYFVGEPDRVWLLNSGGKSHKVVGRKR
jgi:hypothetical protein